MEWKEFKKDVSNFGILTWIFEESSKSVNLLDSTISIEGNEIVKTYQKELNLYQYISPLSNRPPKMIQGIIYSLLKITKKQNIREENYPEMAKLLFHRHVKSRWNRAQTKEYLLHSDMRLRREPQKPAAEPTLEPTATTTNSGKDQLFLRMEYSRSGLPRRAVQSIYDATCKVNFESLRITQMTTVYSRAKNIRDLVIKAKLHQAPSKEASKYYSGKLSNI